MDNSFLSSLNDAQREAVTYSNGPQLVIAGAGSGKTRVLTYKIAYLLSQGVRANSILALTFTNKAAREMKERICSLVPAEDARYLWMGTFHSICARILRSEAEKIGFTRDFSIYDTADMKSVIKQICKERQLDEKIYKPTAVLARISTAKNTLVTADEYAHSDYFPKADKNDRLYEMAAVYRQYELRLKAANAMDFDDLLMNMCLLLQRDNMARQYYQSIFRYILVDEYQDTNYVQYLLVKLLAEPENNICVVGDDAQSIYSFRGADIRNILTFQQTYSNAKLFKLERNYRSTQTIVRAANSLIHHNENQIYKEVYSENEAGERLQLLAFMSDREEAIGVAQSLKKLHAQLSSHTSSHSSFNSFAILYRTNAQSRPLENELRKLNIPYRIYGGTSFYQRKEIKDAIAYFRLAANPKDNEALLRVINFPSRGIGDVTLKKLSEQAIITQCSMLEVAQDPVSAQLLVSAALVNKLQSFAQLIQHFAEQMEKTDAYEFAQTVLRESGILTAAAADLSQEGIDRFQNLQELLNGINEFVRQREEEGISFTPIQDFLAEVSLLTDQDENLQDHTERVTLMTVHAAKGLEFPYVYIVGMEEQLFPSQFCSAPSEIEEERRLLYVAITRAMQRCYLSYARQRFKNGQVSFSSPSRFLKDIDRQYVQVVDTFHQQPPRPTWPHASASFSGRSVSFAKSAAPISASTTISAYSEMDSPFPPGTRVRHRIFGNGIVQRVYHDDSTGNDKIDILFDQVGKKTLLLTYAKLEKI